MPSEYEELVNALKATSIPFAEYGWATRPDGTYGVVGLDFEAGTQQGDGQKQDRSYSVSVDVYYRSLSDRDEVTGIVEGVLALYCGDSWSLNSVQHETETGLFHIEWVCEVTGGGVQIWRTATETFPARDMGSVATNLILGVLAHGQNGIKDVAFDAPYINYVFTRRDTVSGTWRIYICAQSFTRVEKDSLTVTYKYLDGGG